MKVWRVDESATEPREVEVEKWGKTKSEYDAERLPVYTNSHFLTLEEAWKKLVGMHYARLGSAAANVRDQRSILAEAEKHLVDVTLAADEARTKFEKWKAAP